MVDGARPRDVAIERADWPATTARDISSRSAKVRDNLERRRCAGRIPPCSAQMRGLKSGFDRTTVRFVEEIRLSASVPTSTPFDFQYNKSGFSVSSATLLLLTQILVCCIDRLKPQHFAVIVSRLTSTADLELSLI